MNEINKQALMYNKEVNGHFMNVCEFIFSCPHVRFGSFRYFRVFEDNSYLNLSTDCEWLHERMTKIPDNGKAFQTALCSAKKENYTYYLWPHEPGNDSVLNLFYQFNIWNGISVYKRKGRSVEAWSFGSTRNDTQQANFYINNLDYINDFIDYFNRMAAHLIDPTDSSKLAHFSEKLSIDYVEDCISSQTHATVIKDNAQKTLSMIEKQCFRLKANGADEQTIANTLHIRLNTAQACIHNIKNRLGLRTDEDLTQFYFENNSTQEKITKNFDVNTTLNTQYLHDTCTSSSKKEKYWLPAPFNNQYLTKKEFLTLQLIVLGKTTKWIAKEHNMSPRTVEGYIDVLKHKLKCDYKHEIPNIVIQYGLLHGKWGSV